MKIFTPQLLWGETLFAKTKNFQRNGFFLLKQTNENMADPQINMLPNLFQLNIISHAMFVASILQIEVGLGGHIRAQHGMQGTDQKASLTSKRKVEKQEKGKTQKMLPANFTPLYGAWILRWSPCARSPGSEAGRWGRSSPATHRRGTRGDAPSPGEGYTWLILKFKALLSSSSSSKTLNWILLLQKNHYHIPGETLRHLERTEQCFIHFYLILVFSRTLNWMNAKNIMFLADDILWK